MLFNSYEFIFIFLPIVFIGWIGLGKIGSPFIQKLWLVAGSLFFYGYWNPSYLLLIAFSILVNFVVGKSLMRVRRKSLLILGIVFNIALLGVFKYADFFFSTVNFLMDTHIPMLELLLPLGISFFTFQQIGYLVDTYKGETKHYKFYDYILFVTFFPQLIAGPIVHHKEMMPQFKDNPGFRPGNFAKGLFIFSIGLFKKVVIADSIAVYANEGFSKAALLSTQEAWFTSISYSMQLYYDFSGYSDMAIGIGLMFNILLPFNFNAPYKAVNIQDFWKRWHMTLGRFLTEYIYIPLGGSRRGYNRTLVNLMIVFLVSGIWHGAGWTFIIWGALHGVAIVIHRIWKMAGYKLPLLIGWIITFQFVNITWVFFRSPDMDTALEIITAMFSISDSVSGGMNLTLLVWMMILIVGLLALGKSSTDRLKSFHGSSREALLFAVLMILSLLHLNKISDFLYFNF